MEAKRNTEKLETHLRERDELITRLNEEICKLKWDIDLKSKTIGAFVHRMLLGDKI